MKELTVISGKGGTGKTSITAAFATLSANRIVVDADVDAANLFLTLEHEVLESAQFKGGSKAVIDPERCSQCGECLERCQFNAVSENFVIDLISCEGCGVCAHFCPEKAIAFEPRVCGEKFVSRTPWGPMIHARLGIAEENSGLLVSRLRQEAREMAKAKNIPLIITDGPPGIGCPVIASVTNADALLIVTEPTLSGMHDMERVKALADQMRIPTMLCINKADLNRETAEQLKDFARENGMAVVGEIPFDREVVNAMKAGKSLVQFSEGVAASAVKEMWERVSVFVEDVPLRIG